MTTLPPVIHCDILTRETDGIGLVELTADFVAETDAAGTVTVEKGYISDLGSVPRIARPFISIAGKTGRPALLHDWLLHKNDTRANRVFLEALKASNVSWVGRYLMFAFVWLFTAPTFLIDGDA